jgi:hypothetical protein
MRQHAIAALLLGLLLGLATSLVLTLLEPAARVAIATAPATLIVTTAAAPVSATAAEGTPLAPLQPVTPTASPATPFAVSPTPAPSASPAPETAAPRTATPTVTPAPTQTPLPASPSGQWLSPARDGFVLRADTLHLAVAAMPGRPGGAAITEVTFSARWPAQAGLPAGQVVACRATRTTTGGGPTAGSASVFACDWNAWRAGLPNGPLTITFAVVDAAGRVGGPAQGEGERQGTVQQPLRKVIVLLQGVCTAIGAGTDAANTTFTALQNLLQTKGYGYAAGDFLLYSYKGGTVDPAGVWAHRAYGLSDPIRQNFHSTSWSALHDQLLVPYHRHHPNTTFVLVGHSLGGMVAWEEINREMASGHYQQGFLSRVVTIDSPLRGIYRVEMLLGDLLRLYPSIGARLDCVIRGQAANVLLGIALKRNGLASMQQVAARAAHAGISIMNVANIDDCVWSPGKCGIPLQRYPQTQWIGGPAVRTAIFTIPRPRGCR